MVNRLIVKIIVAALLTMIISQNALVLEHILKTPQSDLNVRKSQYLSQLLLFKLVPPDQTPAFEGPAAPVVDQSLLGQQMSFLLSLRALHCFFVPGQTLLLLLLGCTRIFAHLL